MTAPWFLSHPLAAGQCQSKHHCDAPATGYDSNGIALCCAVCVTRDGCRCEFLANQKRLVVEMPIRGADSRKPQPTKTRAKACP